MTTDREKYLASLYTQFLKQELKKAPGDIRGSVGRALVRFSPNATPAERREYVDSIVDTISDDSGYIFNDWSERIVHEHA